MEKKISYWNKGYEFVILVTGYKLITWQGIEEINGNKVIYANFLSMEDQNLFMEEFKKIHSQCPFCVNNNVFPDPVIELILTPDAINNLYHPIKSLQGLCFEFDVFLQTTCNSETCTILSPGIYPDIPLKIRDKLNIRFCCKQP